MEKSIVKSLKEQQKQTSHTNAFTMMKTKKFMVSIDKVKSLTSLFIKKDQIKEEIQMQVY